MARISIVLLVFLLLSFGTSQSSSQSPSGNYVSLYSVLNRPADVVTDPQGFLYVADYANYRVVKLAPSGTGAALVTYNESITISTALFPIGVCLDSALNVYVVSTGNAGLFKYNNAGVLQLAVTSTVTNPPLESPYDCVVDSLGFIYISNSVYLHAHGVIKLAPNGTQVDFITTYSPIMHFPTGIALDSNGSLYVTDSSNNRIVKFNSSTKVQQQVIALPGASYGLAVTSQGTVYASSYDSNLVMVYTANGSFVSNLSTASPTFINPRGLWVDASLNLFVADTENNRIVKFFSSQSPSSAPASSSSSSLPPSSSSPTGSMMSGRSSSSSAAFASSSSATSFTSSADASAAIPGYTVVSLYPGLYGPFDVALDSSNNIYVADLGNHRVVKLQAGTSGNILQTYTFNSGAAPGSPNGVCVDSGSNVYVIDNDNNRVVKFNNSGSVTQIYTANSTASSLLSPVGCAVDSAGILYITDSYHETIHKIAVNGTQVASFSFGATKLIIDSHALYVVDLFNRRVVKMSAETGSVLQTSDLPPDSYLRGVAVDQHGLVYVAADGTPSVYIFASNGTLLSTLAVSADALPLNIAGGLAVDSAGTVYITDLGNNRIVILQPGAGGLSSSSPSPSASSPPLSSSSALFRSFTSSMSSSSSSSSLSSSAATTRLPASSTPISPSLTSLSTAAPASSTSSPAAITPSSSSSSPPSSFLPSSNSSSSSSSSSSVAAASSSTASYPSIASSTAVLSTSPTSGRASSSPVTSSLESSSSSDSSSSSAAAERSASPPISTSRACRSISFGLLWLSPITLAVLFY